MKDNMDIENRNVNIPTKPMAKTPMKLTSENLQKKGMETPKSQIRPSTSASCSKLGLSTPTPFSPTSTNTIGSSAREAARVSKLQSTVERINKVAELKDKWAKEKELKQQLNVVKRAIEFKRLQDDNLIASEKRKANLDKQRAFASIQKQEKKEDLAASLKCRAQLSVDLQLEAKAKRRISVFLNNRIKEKAKANMVKIENEKKQSEIDLLESKRIDHLQTREAKKLDEERKRESMCGRGVAALEQRKVAMEMEQRAASEERDLLETRRQNWEDDRSVKTINEQRKRESLAGRLDLWRKHKTVEEDKEKAELEQQLSDSLTRNEDWRAVQAYKNEEVKQGRESLAGRLNHWREIKGKEAVEKKVADDAASIDFELRTAAEVDVKNYQAQQLKNSRQSLAFRLDKARMDHDYDEGQKALLHLVYEEESKVIAKDHADIQKYFAAEREARKKSLRGRLEHESAERQRLADVAAAQLLSEQVNCELRHQNWQDVQKYKQDQRDAARQSMTMRNQCEQAERQRLKEELAVQQEQQAASFEENHQAWLDVKNHQLAMQKAARESMAGRIAKAHEEHELQLEKHSQMLTIMHEDFELKRMDWQNAQAFKREQREDRRKSMVLRNESWRSQRMAEEKLRQRKELEAEEDARLREQDREALLTAKAQLMAHQRADTMNSSMVL